MAKGNKGPRVEKTSAEKAAIHAAKAEKFKTLAKARTIRAVKAISLLKNLSGAGYVYTDKQVGQILNALYNTCDNVKIQFESKGKKADLSFEFVE